MDLTRLERAALDLFGPTYSDEVPGLTAHLEAVSVVSRENTGGGFFTYLSIDPEMTRPIDSPSPLDGLIVQVEGMVGTLEFLLFFEGGYANLLEAYAREGGDTEAVDFETAPFGEITSLWPKNSN